MHDIVGLGQTQVERSNRSVGPFGDIVSKHRPYKVHVKDLWAIKDFSLAAFHRTRNTHNMGAAEVQQYMIIQGLFDFLKAKGIHPNFEVEDLNEKEENSDFDSVEDLS